MLWSVHRGGDAVIILYVCCAVRATVEVAVSFLDDDSYEAAASTLRHAVALFFTAILYHSMMLPGCRVSVVCLLMHPVRCVRGAVPRCVRLVGQAYDASLSAYTRKYIILCVWLHLVMARIFFAT